MISEWVGSDRVGSVIEGRFHLQRWLGGAEESGVFLTQIGGVLPRKAAIKMIPAGIADAESLLEQWSKAKQRSHPNLIRLFHAGYCRIDDCDLLYAVTDCADEILADVLRARPLTPAEVREMLDPLLDTLSWLHGQGLVHGGLKPSNVMVVNEQIELSVDRIQPTGSRIYPVLSPGVQDAPESAGKIAPAADLWSLGVLLVEALTQNPPPWDGTGYRIPASIPQPFAGIASECLRLDPAHRCTLREIRARLAPAPRAAAPAAPVSSPPAPDEPARIDPAQDAVSAGRSTDLATNLSPDLLPIAPPVPLVKPPHLAERVAALLAPAPAAAPAVSQIAPAQSAAEAIVSVEAPSVFDAPAALEETAAAVTPVTPAPPVDPPIADAPAAEAPVAVSLMDEAPKSGGAAPAADTLPAGTLAEAPAVSAPEQPALETRHESRDGANARSLGALDERAAPSAAAAMQRRASVPEAAPVKAAPKPPNRRATLVASAMIVIAAGLMLTIALHRSNRVHLTAARSSAPGEPQVPARAIPPPQAAVPPASSPSAVSAPLATVPPAPGMPVSVTSDSAPPMAAASVPAGATAPGAVIDRVLPHVTQRALDTIDGQLVVIVRVRVDASGNVSDAGYDYEGNSHYLKTAALEAARNWKFRPAQAGGHPVPSTWVLQFWFDRTGPTVIAKEAAS